MDNLSANITTKKISKNLFAMIITINEYSKELNANGSHLTPVSRVKLHSMKGKAFTRRSAASYWASKYRVILGSQKACQDFIDNPSHLMRNYYIIRFCADEKHPSHKRIIKRGLTREEAQAHCQNQCLNLRWFDGFDKEAG